MDALKVTLSRLSDILPAGSATACTTSRQVVFCPILAVVTPMERGMFAFAAIYILIC